jgi:hypothetical protein
MLPQKDFGGTNLNPNLLSDTVLTLFCRDQPFWVDSMIFHFFVIESTQKGRFYALFLFVNFGANFFEKSRQ